MAYDFDFKRPSKATKTNTRPIIKEVPAIKPAQRYRDQKAKGKWSILLLIIGLIVIATEVYLQFSKPASDPITAQSNTAPTDIDPGQVKVGVYANGLDLGICRDLANSIGEMGYVGICVGQSLATHDQAEIWVAEGYRSEAEMINVAQGLKANIRILNSESQYKIIIYTGS